MKIVHVSNTNSGGALELHNAMLEEGIDSKLLVKGFDFDNGNNIFRVNKIQRYISNIGGLLSKIIIPKNSKNLPLFSIPIIGAKLTSNILIKNADIIYLHFVAQSSFISLNEINNLLNLRKPVIFVVRDIWPFTGGCHYFIDCMKFEIDCKPCPYFKNNSRLIYWSSYQLFKKASIYNKHNKLYFIALSNWTNSLLEQSIATKLNRKLTIGNPINTKTFKIEDKLLFKARLGLPTDVPIIGFGARNVENRFKGFSYLQEALIILKESGTKLALATFGSSKYNGPDIYNFGYIKNRNDLASFYNALDVFVSPTLSDTFGNTVAEAMACGIPVVGFNTGGLKDIIDHKINGYLANYMDPEDLARGIQFFLKNELLNNNELRQQIRQKIVQNFSSKVIVNKHIEFIRNII